MSTSSFNLDAEALYLDLLEQIKSQTTLDQKLAIVGIYSGGAWLAERLAKDLALHNKAGFIDVSFYRDDYAQKGLHAEVKPTQIPFDVNGASIILVDDVLYTGRTTRAAINELFDYGRPAKIMLATLVDRGGRELPIAADFAAHTIDAAAYDKSHSINLQRAEDGTFSLSIDHA
ncbi:bifunctional pyr operon transcriptional regulator/uracil phosphoribosyltransferase PyrR [Undibacterium terreum]|uniref:Bifunctional pyr operon transcriptional regulator/uracil phosphoribosyltransferase n=1 Tax=Undibacterium terreum TaxID=1224302 RepID=A0A916XKW5_9BURK|nr:bifunctional pyr operon transcriptional regulator/uracil phosphoribosyltransferase PyrR [Undibacterium terreum]GGC82549.1 bifunctional pyr operon transcriptional regulator/uracil phosphoribosyltransferase [Undibacterium terreum]